MIERLEPANPHWIGHVIGLGDGQPRRGGNPEILSATFNVGGSSTDQGDCAVLQDRKKNLDTFLLDSRGLKVGSQGYEDFFIIARWMLDPADNQNLGRHYIDEPLINPKNSQPYGKKRISISSGFKTTPGCRTAPRRRRYARCRPPPPPPTTKRRCTSTTATTPSLTDFGSASVVEGQKDAVEWLQ